MPKRKRVGLVVWGSILVTMGLFLLLSVAVTKNGWSMRSGMEMTTFALFLLLGGGILLGFGIRNFVLVSKYNNALENENAGITYCMNCFYCNYPVSVTYRDFQPHRRYPEGFIYCPFCKRPLSKNAFQRIAAQPPIYPSQPVPTPAVQPPETRQPD